MEDTLLIVLVDGRFLEMQFADGCDFYSEGCDAAVDYTLYDRFHEEIDGGQMDYASDEKKYGCIRDAIADLIDFALDLQGGATPAYYVI